MAAKPVSMTTSSLSAGAVAAIVLSVLTLLSIIGYFLWRVFRRRTRLVRHYKGKVDLIEKFTPGHRKNPSQSSERPLLHEPTSRAQSPASLRSNVSAWLQGQRADQQSYPYHGVGSHAERPSRLNIQDLSSDYTPQRPAPPLETIYSAVDAEPLPDRFKPGIPPKRPAPPLESLYSDIESVDYHIPRRPARPAPLYSTTSLVSTNRDSESTFRIDSTLDKFPAPPQSESSTFRGIVRKVGDRLSRSFSPSRLETESVQDRRLAFRRKFHQQSASLDMGASSTPAPNTPRSIRGRLVPPPPTLPPPSLPPSIPLPNLPAHPKAKKVIPLSPTPDTPAPHLSPPTSSRRGIPFDVNVNGGVVNTHAIRPVRMERGLTHHKSASIY